MENDTRTARQLTLRLVEPLDQTIRELATEETEGNESAMVRKLIWEALRARAPKENSK
jgi:hypothetical protein